MKTYFLLGVSGLIIALPDAGVVEKTDPVIVTEGNGFAFLQIIFYIIPANLLSRHHHSSRHCYSKVDFPAQKTAFSLRHPG